MTLRDSISASVRAARTRRVRLTVFVEDAITYCRSDGAIAKTGISCPNCGRGLIVEVPDEDEGDAVCERCGDRVGRVLRR
jgi:DNA-directed RNA polymerase subunit RPC12/RpoP